MAEEQKPLTEENSEQGTVLEAEQDQTAETNMDSDETPASEPVVSAEEELQKKLDEAENSYLRLRADFDNFRRRVNLDREAQEKYRAQKLITELLPALDNFERALAVKPEHEDTKSLLHGVEMVYNSMIAALESEGVSVIETVGQPFDPHVHQAVMMESDASAEANTVLAELQKGYKLKDRVIRPAMVKVNQ